MPVMNANSVIGYANTVGLISSTNVCMSEEYIPSKRALIRVAKSIVSSSDIGEPMQSVPEGKGYFVTKSGEFYHKYGEDKYVHLKTPVVKRTGGYRYANLSMGNGKHKSFRAHKLVARAWIPNPEKLPIVGHKNNNKSDNRVDNLYWTTWSENIQKAVNDGLLVNDKGFNDSQSTPVVCLDMGKKLLATYGSACEAHRATGVSKSTIGRQISHIQPTMPRCGYFFLSKKEYDKTGISSLTTIETTRKRKQFLGRK